jgi:hypothetical protein
MKGKPAPRPFIGYNVYGPYGRTRRSVTLISQNGIKGIDQHAFSLAYAKYLMSVQLGRQLEPYEIVHHKNENPLDDSLENLEVVSHGLHGAIHTNGWKMKVFVCQSCGKEFESRDDGQYRKYCSRECFGRRYILSNKEYEQFLVNSDA